MNVLGARELAQGVVQLARPTALRRVFIGVDLAHAGSMALLAALDARRRRPALLSAGLALTSAVVSWRAR